MRGIASNLTALPNLHPALVHFPVALLLAAVGFDAMSLLLRRQVWLDRSAAALYALGAMGAGAAYLAGRQAEDSLTEVPAAMQPLIAAHADWAFWTLLLFTGVAAARIVIAWAGRGRSVIHPHAFRWLVLAAALAGQWLLLGTADRGGALVYRHGLAVARAADGPGGPREARSTRADATRSGAEPSRAADGSISWRPSGDDERAPGSLFKIVEDPVLRVAVPAGGDTSDGGALALEVTGRGYLLALGVIGDVQVEATVNVADFRGTFGLVHHARWPDAAGIFQIGQGGRAALALVAEGATTILDEAAVTTPSVPVRLTVSAAGSHLKGMVDGQVVVHGHHEAAPGCTGFYVDGSGVIRILEMKVIPLKGG